MADKFPVKDAWLKNMKFAAAGVSKQESANFIIENNPKFDGLLKKGFYGADILVTEGKNSGTGTVSFGTCVLLQDPDTWGRQDKSKRRWAITAAHTVMTTGREGNPKKVSELRLRKPILPWKGFPKDTEKYKPGPDATNHLYDSIIIPRKHIFPHPKFDGNWNCGYDVALIAIPEMAPSENAIKLPFVSYDFDNFPDSICVNGFPALNLNQKRRHTHIPYYSIRKRDDNDDEWEVSIIRPRKKVNTGARMLRYPVTTKPGISGGAVVAEGNVIGIHNAKRNATNGWGTVFTKELKSWIEDIHSNEWDTSLGKYVSPNAHHENAIKIQAIEKKNDAQMKELMAKMAKLERLERERGLERERANNNSGGNQNNNSGAGYQMYNQMGGIFSNNKKQTGSPFGNISNDNNIGSSIFGNNNKSGGNGGLFGSNGGGIFGNNHNKNNSGGLFGNKSQNRNNSGGLFGNNNSRNNNNSGGLFDKSDRHMQGNQESGVTQGERFDNQQYVINKDIPRKERTTPSKPTPNPKPRKEHTTQSKPSPKSKPNPQSAKEENIPISAKNVSVSRPSANTGEKRGRTDPPVPSNAHPPKRTQRENTGRSKPCDAELLKPGTVVVLTGLTSPKGQELNGKTATIERFDDSSARWIVNLGGKQVTVRQENIKRKDRTTRRSQQIPTEQRRDRHASYTDLFTVLRHEEMLRYEAEIQRNLEAQRRVEAQRRREAQRKREAESLGALAAMLLGQPPPRRSFFRRF